jgi:hypothetical protein
VSHQPQRETACQTGKQNGTLSSEMGVRVVANGVRMIADRRSGSSSADIAREIAYRQQELVG